MNKESTLPAKMITLIRTWLRQENEEEIPMAPNTDHPKPAIDDSFWFRWSGELVSNSLKRRSEVTESFQKLVVWLWGIYTAAVAVRITLVQKAMSSTSRFLAVLPVFLLIFLYWVTVWVRIPIKVEFDPRAPKEIEQAYVQLIEIIDFRLKVMFWISLAAVLFVAIAVSNA